MTDRRPELEISTDWTGHAKPGPWYGRYYEDWDAAHPKAWVRGQAVPGRFYAGDAVGILHAGLGCGLVSRARSEDAQGRALMVPGRDKTPLTDKLDPTDTGVMRLQFRQIR